MSLHKPTMRIVAAALVLTLPAAFTPVPAASTLATVSGHIVASGSVKPVAGARVHVADRQTGKIYTSEPTRDDGSFAVSNLPSAAYEMAVESNGGLYRVDKPFKLAAGEARKVNLAIEPNAQPASGTATPASSGKKSGGGVWSSPALASVIVVGSAIIVGVIIDNATSSPESKSVSPF